MSVGYFHRSHQAVYLDELARLGERGWGLTGIGLRNAAMRDALLPQDCLYTVVERDAAGDRARIVGAMTRYHFAPDDPRAAVKAIGKRRTRLVTMTVTGAGYHADPSTGEFDVDDEEVAADLADPTAPRSALGLLVEGLARRRRTGRPGLTILSCDNMPANGDVARTAVVGFARLRDERLADWIERNVTFPSSMVDRITPKTTEKDRARLARKFGVHDRWPVMTEPYSDWVIEDSFANGRPPLEEVGVRFVADVRPYALIKTRLLNATHSALGHLGSLAGLRTTDEAMADPLFGDYVERLTGDEIAPLLPRLPGLDLVDYRRTVLLRLANPKIADQLDRLCRGGSLKVPRHVLPSIAEHRRHGRPHPLLTLAVAGFCAHVRSGLGLDDPSADRLRALARDPRGLLTDRVTFGALAGDDGFVADVTVALATIERHGVRAALAAGELVAA
ncbi:MAG TPA: mannitol dehydrogenase family protein [Solirubrobacteraceae bacterium]|nr:mannitol dehydrogenase family protein [Solirubrobacteraceae bacterium]